MSKSDGPDHLFRVRGPVNYIESAMSYEFRP